MKYAFFDRSGQVIGYGDKVDAVRQAFGFQILDDRVLKVHVRGFKEVTYHSYNYEYTDEEIIRDIANFLIREAGSFGITCLKEIGWTEK